MLELNLQYFAKEGPGGEKTEEPTSKKLEDARKDGKVAKSKELSSGFELITLFLVLKLWIGNMGERFVETFDRVYSNFDDFTTYWGGDVQTYDFHLLFVDTMLQMLIMLLPFFVLGVAISIIANLMQFKFKVSTKPLQPKLSKINPLSGFKRLFSVEKLMELLKSILKIALISIIVYNTIKDDWVYLFQFYDMPLMQGIEVVGEVVINLGLKISLFFMVIAFADFAYQKYKHHQDLKMTKQEVKDEYKNSEGDPQIKGKIRQRMQEASRRRMMQDVTKADVVITNPTHFAVAIRYDASEHAAPVVLAKGADYLAQKIKGIARENGIEIVENKPLARMLYANVEVGQEVPPELYQAVAEVLAFVYKMQGKVG